jgi:predicted P-loop ATPase/GTPase
MAVSAAVLASIAKSTFDFYYQQAEWRRYHPHEWVKKARRELRQAEREVRNARAVLNAARRAARAYLKENPDG